MATALIHFTQGSNTDVAGKAVLGDYGDFSAITITNGSNTGIVSWKIYLLDAPPDSVTFPVTSQPQVLAQASDSTPTCVFTPDVAGTYRVMLEVTSASSVVDRDIRCFGIPDRRGFVRPPFQVGPEPLPLALPGIISLDPRPTKPDEQNYGSNQRGWAGNGPVGQLDQFFQQYDDLPQKVVTTTPYTAATTDPPLHLVNVTGSPVFNLPNAPRVGAVFRVVCIGDPVTVTPQGGGASIGGAANDVLQTSEGALYVYQGSNIWRVVSRELSPKRRLPIGTLTNQFPVWNQGSQIWQASAGSFFTGWVSVLDYLPGHTMVAAINLALADAAAAGVYFPPGVYAIDAALTSGLDDRQILFQPGAVLQMDANGLGSLTINGARSKIQGDPTVRFAAASSVTYVAIDLHGVASHCERVRFELNADVPNCTLMRLSGDYSSVGQQDYAGTAGSFKYGVLLGHQDGTQLFTGKAGRSVWSMGDDGVTHNFSALIRMRSTLSQVGPLVVRPSGRHAFNSIVEVEGQHNSCLDPQIKANNALYGFLIKDDSEFFDIYDGEISANFLANSIGIACGDGSKPSGPPATGQLKCYGTRITNWDIGVRITGTSDTPSFFGATIANNKTAHVVIDSKRGSDEWPVSGLSFYGCYSEEAAFPGAPFLHLISGALLGGICCGCEIGYTDTAILVESTMGGNVMEFYGCRIPGAGVANAVTTPNANSFFFFGAGNAMDGSTGVGRGTFASKAMKALDPVMTGLVIGTQDPAGSSNNHITRLFTDIYTANFGTVGPGSIASLDLGFASVPTITTSGLRWSISGTLGAKALQGIIFQFWIDTFGHIVGTATNVTGASVSSVSGGVRFEIVVFG